MTEIYYPFSSGAGSGVSQDRWSDMARLWRTTGVETGEGLELLGFGDSSGMQVKLKTGQAWIEGHYYENDAEKTLAIATADGSNPRIDNLVIEVDWVSRVVASKIVTGTPAATPAAPALVQNTSVWQLKIAEILVGTGVSTINAGDVTDYRYFSRAKMDAWIPADEDWTYSSWDDTNGVSTAVFTVPTDATEKYFPGMRIRFSQPTDGEKFGIVTKVTATELTVFINTDYDFDNEEIIRPHYSVAKSPFGFDADTDKWKVQVTDAGIYSQASPAGGTWYNLGSITIDIPVGLWGITHRVAGHAKRSSSFSSNMAVTLSTGAATESDADHTGAVFVQNLISQNQSAPYGQEVTREKYFSSKTTMYLNEMTPDVGDDLEIVGDVAATRVTAICGYL